MPGQPFLFQQASFQGVTGEGVPAQARSVGGSDGPGWGFFLWLALIGVVIPVVVLGSLRAGGFQFVYKRR